MSGRLEGQVAIVTGAGQGIGRGIALALAGEGAAVALAGRTPGTLEAVAAEVAARGGRAVPVRCDVSDADEVVALVERVAGDLGRIDVLVNNAQSFTFATLEDTSEDDLDLAYRSGPLASFRLMRACLPHLRLRGGNVVNLATSSALTGEARFGSYAMAKEAIRALTRVAATEWGPLGIRVNCICPSGRSPAYEAFERENPELAARLAAERPLGRMGDPEADIGRAVVALVSDDLAYLTGATLMLNGGRVYLG